MYFMPLGVTLPLMLLPGILMAIRCVCLVGNLISTNHLPLQSIRTVEQEHPDTFWASTVPSNANSHRHMGDSVARRET